MKYRWQTFLEREERSVIVCGAPTFVAARGKCSIFVSNLRRIENKHGGAAVLSSQRQTANTAVTLLRRGRKEKCTSLSRRYEVARIQRGVLSGITRVRSRKTIILRLSGSQCHSRVRVHFHERTTLLGAIQRHFYLCATYSVASRHVAARRETR